MQKLYVINHLFLGKRELGYEIYSEENGILEMTTKQLISGIKAGIKVCGLKISTDGNKLELDEKFYTTNLLEKRHIGNYKPHFGLGNASNVFYTVLEKIIENGNPVYRVINSTFKQMVLNEEEVKTYIRLGIVSSGAKLENDKIIVASDEVEEAPKPEPKAEIKAEAKPEIKAETKIETKVELKPEIKPAPKAEVKVEAKAEIKDEVKAKVEKKQ